MKNEIPEFIMERVFEAVDSHGVARTITLQVGQPFFNANSETSLKWRCPMRIIGIGSEHIHKLSGIDSLNALLISLQLAGALIRSYADDRQLKITWLNEDDLGLPPLPESDEATDSLLDAEDNPFQQAFDAFFQNLKQPPSTTK